MRIETLARHAGRGPDPATGALHEPIHLSTTFERATDGSDPHGYSYRRADNPNRAALEAAVAALQGAPTAVPGALPPVNLIRLSVGLEHVDDLTADFDQVPRR